MFNLVCRSLVLAVSLAFAGLAVTVQFSEASQSQGHSHMARAEHAVAGEVKKIDHDAKTLVIRTADGIDETVKFTEKTVVRGAKDVAHAGESVAKAGLEGAVVVLHYTGEGVDRTATSIDKLAKTSLKVAKGSVSRVDKAGKFIVVKTEAGAEETFHVTKDVVVDSSRGVKRAARATGHAMKEGAEVVVHYSEEAGEKLAHLVKLP